MENLKGRGNPLIEKGSLVKFSMRSGGGAEERAAGDVAHRGQQLTDTTRCVGCGRALPVLGVGWAPSTNRGNRMFLHPCFSLKREEGHLAL